MTSVPTVKAALVTALRTALTDVQVIYGPRSAVTVTDARVLTVEGVRGRRDVTDIELNSALEVYEVLLEAAVGLPGADSLQTAEEQALDIFASSVVAVSAMDLDNIALAVSGDFRLDETAGADGRVAVVAFPVSVTAPNA